MEEFKQLLISTFNNNTLPFEAKVYVMRDIMHEMETIYRAELERRSQEAKAKEDKPSE